MTEHWHDVGAEGDVVADEALAVTIGDQEIGVYRIGGALYAIEDVCPHAYALLSQGFIEGEEVECPLHEAVFHIPSGRCLKEPAERDLKTYEVKAENGRVLVRVAQAG